MSHLPEFLTIILAHGLAVASPGPDFAIVLQQSLRHGRRTAIWTAVGIGCGLSIHLGYVLFGLGVLVARSASALAIVKWLGAAYLAWLGVQALRSRAQTGDISLSGSGDAPTPTAAWRKGFLVNVLNPKAALFLISLFSLAVSPATPRLVQVGYGLWMTVTTALWFAFVAVVFTQERVRRAFLRNGHWIDRALGVVFLGFAGSLAFGTLA